MTHDLSLPAAILAGVLLVAGALGVLVSAIAVTRVKDAVTRVNSLGVASAFGLPTLILGAYVIELDTAGFATMTLVKVLLSVAAWLAVSSVGTNVLARATYRATEHLDERTSLDALGGPEALPPPDDEKTNLPPHLR